jgi:hypothetical protein
MAVARYLQDATSCAARDRRVKVPLTRVEWLQMRRYAAAKGLPVSRVLLEFAAKAIQQVLVGADPLGTLERPAQGSNGATH